MRALCLLVFLSSFSLAAYAAEKQSCTPQEQHKVLKPIDNWSIVAYNTAVIKVAPYFSGSKLTYSMTHQPVKSKKK